MSFKLGEVEIFDVIADSYATANLFDGITEKNLDDFESKWRPILRQHVNDAHQNCTSPNGNFDRQHFRDELGKLNIQDAAWEWRKKLSAHPQPSLYYKFISLERDGITQGLMSIDLGTRRCRIDSQLNQHVVYIDYLAIAPWNRPQLRNPPLYRMIGRVLVATAISASIDAGFNGRISLHSLPQANDYYENKCNMTALGIDIYKENLTYFEMTPQQAKMFLDD